ILIRLGSLRALNNSANFFSLVISMSIEIPYFFQILIAIFFYICDEDYLSDSVLSSFSILDSYILFL
ncbi:hypothetical protein, partial [Oenococcus oeni]|uniref:hypothetical protein n=1 Tax=Oenococcus oeni TaxID=1247 RepID=UPI001C5BA47E